MLIFLVRQQMQYQNTQKSSKDTENCNFNYMVKYIYLKKFHSLNCTCTVLWNSLKAARQESHTKVVEIDPKRKVR